MCFSKPKPPPPPPPPAPPPAQTGDLALNSKKKKEDGVRSRKAKSGRSQFRNDITASRGSSSGTGLSIKR